ncbi:MAG: WD40/YVTN/BNR-like repeat-containing protein, partial [Candidatus Aminicenantaceae bacterium]
MSKKNNKPGLGFLILVVVFALLGSLGYSREEPRDALLKSLEWRNIGPANMGGRISDIQALDTDFRVVIVASASGGVWKTTNAGTTWEPIFDGYGSGSIGAVGLFPQDPDIIWVGTGEANVRNSVGWGDGIYKSIDGGNTFINLGLKDTHHIAKIATHPTDPDIVYAAAQGHLWGHTGQRGLFRTADGGRTWERLSGGLPDDGRTGCTHVMLDPQNADVIYAAFWERLRRPFRFDSGGPNSGLFKSVDAGRTWKKLTNGLPEGDIGRIGIAVFRKDPRIVMAIVEHGYQPRRRSEEYEDMTKLGTGIYRSEDGGETWAYLNRYNVRPFYYSQIYINPLDADRVYVMGTQAMVSYDGGRTLTEGMPGIAGDFHVMWLDPGNQDRYYVGNDKGISITHDHGEHYNFFDNFCISQIYNISADFRDPYSVYVGLQDNGIWGGPSNSRDIVGITNDDWFKFHSGDGFVTAVDPLDWTTVYSESQGGRMRRNHAVFRQVSVGITPSLRNTLNWKEAIPKAPDAAHPSLRMNWNTPFIISPHNPRTLYYGANFLFKSVDRGDTWQIISPDLSTNDPVKTNRESGGVTRDVTSAETHCSIVTLSESPLKPGVIWAGTDDGNVQLTQDDGASWTNLRDRIPRVPEGLWVSRVEASHHDLETCYVTFDGHRSDDFRPFVFRTRDLGQTWEDITSDLPAGHCTYVIREDPKNPDLLFVGTEFTAFVSWDGGKAWKRLDNQLPTVAVHDLLI